MADLVGLEPAPNGIPGPGAPGVDGGVGDEGGGGEDRPGRMPGSVQRRINEITAQRHQAEQRAAQAEARLAELDGTVKRLEGVVMQTVQKDQPKGWDALKTDDLQRLVAQELHAIMSPPEPGEDGKPAGPAPDPNIIAKAVREMIAREIGAARESAQREHSETSKVSAEVNAARQQAIKEFGADCFNPETELGKAAYSEWSALKQKYGDAGLRQRHAQFPEMEYLAVAAAAAKLASSGRLVNRETAKMLEDLRRRAGVATSGNGMAAEASRYSDSLKKGDIDGALADLADRFRRGTP